ncbi:7004_t:CDS:2 [Diversispora eburnea]|uniref:7004_t:CDS:1 n=1 Tax=Diversispora eburnea TaxID=1213867 RepID=A0A9N8UW84_9GLOM|nr:7004_t:CDS:2 [Diversispora eburnea]
MAGNYFYQGCGTEKDIIKAINWLNKANENGSAIAWDLLEEIIDRLAYKL